jgi:hypothetical protein
VQKRRAEPGQLAAPLLAAALLSACASPGPRYATWQVETPVATRPEPGTPAPIDFHGIPLRDGQLVVSEQGSPLGMLLSLLSAEAFPWIHVGIIAIEGGKPYVYESNGQLRPTWSSQPPNAAVGGGVRRMSLDWFVANQSYIAIHAPPAGADPAKLVAFARDSHARQVRFDPWFDLDDPGRMYCTEFVALGLVAAGAPTVETTAVHPGRSIGVLRDWLQIRATHMIPAAALIGDSERVALISKKHSPAQTSAWFALRQELHRRFTPDQKVGNLLSFSPLTGLDFQPPVRETIRVVDIAARDWDALTETEIDLRVRQIATEKLGFWPQKQNRDQTVISTGKPRSDPDFPVRPTGG